MQHQTVPQTDTDEILAALAAAGLTVTGHQIEADSIDIHLAHRYHLDYEATSLSWRPDGKGWYLLPIDDSKEVEWPADYLGASEPSEVVSLTGHLVLSRPEKPTKPDYWLALADDLRQVADRIATLAGTEMKPSYVSFGIQVAAPGNRNPVVTAHVDTLAAVFGVKAETKKSPGGCHAHGANTTQGDLRVSLYGYVPAPEDPEKAALLAEVEQLRAQLAEGGAK